MEFLLGRKKAAEFLKLTSPKKILDVATGTGSLAFELARLGHYVTAIDSSKDTLVRAKMKYHTHPHLHFELADATDLPYKACAFDVSSISFALHDMPGQIGLTVLREMKRVTNPKGRMLLVDYNEPNKNWGARLTYPLIKMTESKSYRSFVRGGLEGLLQSTGLKTERETTYLGVVRIIVAKL